MAAVITQQTQALHAHAVKAPASPLFYRFTGLALVALLPALFWVCVIAVVAPIAGFKISASALAVVGGAILMFLGSVCAPLVLKASN